jgi:hypothetical protein
MPDHETVAEQHRYLASARQRHYPFLRHPLHQLFILIMKTP